MTLSFICNHWFRPNEESSSAILHNGFSPGIYSLHFMHLPFWLSCYFITYLLRDLLPLFWYISLSVELQFYYLFPPGCTPLIFMHLFFGRVAILLLISSSSRSLPSSKSSGSGIHYPRSTCWDIKLYWYFWYTDRERHAWDLHAVTKVWDPQ